MITTLALLHCDKLQRIHDAPPDSTTGLLQQVRTLSAASGWERGKTWKNMEGMGRNWKNWKNMKQRIPDPSSSSLILNIRQLPFQLTLGSGPHRDLPRSAEFSDNCDSPAQAHRTIWSLFVTDLPCASIGIGDVTVMLGINTACRIL